MSKPKKRRLKHSRRKVRCTICTSHRWYGNNRGRFKDKEEDARKRADREIKSYLAVA